MSDDHGSSLSPRTRMESGGQEEEDWTVVLWSRKGQTVTHKPSTHPKEWCAMGKCSAGGGSSALCATRGGKENRWIDRALTTSMLWYAKRTWMQSFDWNSHQQ